MALRRRLITDLHHLLRIINDMSSDNNLSNADDNHSISIMLGQSDCLTVTVGVDLGHDAPTPGLSTCLQTFSNIVAPYFQAVAVQRTRSTCAWIVLPSDGEYVNNYLPAAVVLRSSVAAMSLC